MTTTTWNDTTWSGALAPDETTWLKAGGTPELERVIAWAFPFPNDRGDTIERWQFAGSYFTHMLAHLDVARDVAALLEYSGPDLCQPLGEPYSEADLRILAAVGWPRGALEAAARVSDWVRAQGRG